MSIMCEFYKKMIPAQLKKTCKSGIKECKNLTRLNENFRINKTTGKVPKWELVRND